MLKNELVKIGMTDKESKIYLAVLELGEASIQKLSQKAQVKRTTAYDILESLKQKGFIGITTQKKRKLYFAQNPKKLEYDLDEKKSVVKNIMPELLAIANNMDVKPAIKYFEGIEGIREVHRDTLEYHGKEIVSWFPQKPEYEVIGDNFYNEYYIPKRIAMKISMRAIIPDNEAMRKLHSKDEISLRKTKFARFSIMPDVEILIYGERKVAIVSFEEKFGIIIESQKIHTTLKGIFEMNWAML